MNSHEQNVSLENVRWTELNGFAIEGPVKRPREAGPILTWVKLEDRLLLLLLLWAAGRTDLSRASHYAHAVDDGLALSEKTGSPSRAAAWRPAVVNIHQAELWRQSIDVDAAIIVWDVDLSSVDNRRIELVE